MRASPLCFPIQFSLKEKCRPFGLGFGVSPPDGTAEVGGGCCAPRRALSLVGTVFHHCLVEELAPKNRPRFPRSR